MATPNPDKYHLKTLHDEIDLFDRKLAHMEKYDSFATDAERLSATNKMNSKRELLVKAARQLANDGIEYKPSDLPRSFRTGETPEPEAKAAVAPEAQEPKPVVAKAGAPVRQFPSPFAGTVLDGENTIMAYKRARQKETANQA